MTQQTPSDRHTPVLLNEVLEFLQPERGGVFIDGTLGMGGHTEAGLARAQQAGAKVKWYGIDRDPFALDMAEERLGDAVTYRQGNFADLVKLRAKGHLEQADGILLDLGVSSYQLDTPQRGFSFLRDGPLDMRMDPDQGVTAQSVVNTWPLDRLEHVIRDYGEERYARQIVHAIGEARKKATIRTTHELAELIRQAVPGKAKFGPRHPATRTFQAIRMAVNEELESVDAGITAALDLLAPGGVLVILTFHSLEDRLVKRRFRAAGGRFTILTKRPLVATDEEVRSNVRSRSAKLRAIRREA